MDLFLYIFSRFSITPWSQCYLIAVFKEYMKEKSLVDGKSRSEGVGRKNKNIKDMVYFIFSPCHTYNNRTRSSSRAHGLSMSRHRPTSLSRSLSPSPLQHTPYILISQTGPAPLPHRVDSRYTNLAKANILFAILTFSLLYERKIVCLHGEKDASDRS